VAPFHPAAFGGFHFHTVASFLVQGIGSFNPQMAQALVATVTGKQFGNAKPPELKIDPETLQGMVPQVTAENFNQICSDSSPRLCAIAFLVGDNEEKLNIVKEVSEQDSE